MKEMPAKRRIASRIFRVRLDNARLKVLGFTAWDASIWK